MQPKQFVRKKHLFVVANFYDKPVTLKSSLEKKIIYRMLKRIIN